MNQITPSADEQQLIEKYADADPRTTALKLKATAEIRPLYVLQQIQGQQIARRKLPAWADTKGIVFPQHLSLEQCSSFATAQYKSTLAAGESLLDLTGGLGVDFWQMAKQHRRATYVERQPELAEIARHNMPLLGTDNAEIFCADGAEYVQLSEQHYSTIFIDPARRDNHGHKTVHLSDCTPNVAELLPSLLAKADTVLIKLSPMLDIAEALQQLGGVEELHVVAVDGECKELLLLIKNNAKPLTINAINITKSQSYALRFTPDEERNAACTIAERPLTYIYEPNAAIMKAGAYRTIAERFNIEKLHPNTHLYTSENLISDFPGRLFQLEDFCPMGKKEIKRLLSGIKKANVAVRNMPLSTDELRRKLGVADGGNVFIYGTTLKNGEMVVMKMTKK